MVRACLLRRRPRRALGCGSSRSRAPIAASSRRRSHWSGSPSALLPGSWIAPKLLSETRPWVSIASLLGAIVGAALLGAASATLAETPSSLPRLPAGTSGGRLPRRRDPRRGHRARARLAHRGRPRPAAVARFPPGRPRVDDPPAAHASGAAGPRAPGARPLRPVPGADALRRPAAAPGSERAPEPRARRPPRAASSRSTGRRAGSAFRARAGSSAGTSSPRTRTSSRASTTRPCSRRTGSLSPRRSCYVDTQNDVALLRVHGLRTAPLAVDRKRRLPARRRDLGYPRDGALAGAAATAGAPRTVLAPNAYGRRVGPAKRRPAQGQGRSRVRAAGRSSTATAASSR